MTRNLPELAGWAKKSLQQSWNGTYVRLSDLAAKLRLPDAKGGYAGHPAPRDEGRQHIASLANRLHNVTERLMDGPFANARDAPVFRFSGDKYSHCYGAPDRAPNNGRAGRAVFLAVLGISAMSLVGGPVWFIFFYQSHKAKYEKLARGEEDL